MEDRARELAAGQQHPTLSRKQQEEAWRKETIEALTPLISEYAQAIARTGLRLEQYKNLHVFQPRLTLGSDGYSATATCQFIVNRSGSWKWLTPPITFGHPGRSLTPQQLTNFERELTEKLSFAIRDAARQTAERKWWQF